MSQTVIPLSDSHDAEFGVGELISFVVPVFNEQESLPLFHSELAKFLDENKFRRFEIIYVNDGSQDESRQVLQNLASSHPNVSAINLSRNFGKEVALTAGLDHATGQAVVLIDADLQHPLHIVLDFIDHWRDGSDVVYAVQKNRKQNPLRKAASRVFHFAFSKLGGRYGIQRNAGDFRLLSRKAVDKLNRMREQHRTMKGLYPVVGLKQTAVPYDVLERRAGKTKWNFLSLVNLSVDAITSVSTAPLRLATLFGVMCAILSMFFVVFTITKTLILGEAVAGYPTLITVILFLGSAQLLCLGIIGEYLGRVFNETKNRPLYFVDDIFGQAEEGEEKRVATPESEQSMGGSRENTAA